jgi:hypothetical protein
LNYINIKSLIYGCDDFINDDEGMSGYEEYRHDLTLMYFLDFDSISLKFKVITLVPLRIRNFSLHHANMKNIIWLLQTLNQHSKYQSTLMLYCYSNKIV